LHSGKQAGRDFFNVLATDGCARAGELKLGEITVPTPYFQPIASRGAVKDATFEDIREIGYPLILMNTYHLICRPGVEVINQLGGLKNFTGWKGGLLTDSGGFQIFSLSPITRITNEGVSFRDYESGAEFFMTPEQCIDAQLAFGSDIIMALDVCTGLPAEREKVERDLMITHEWAQRASERFRERMAEGRASTRLFGIVQGGVDEELRQKSIEFISSLDFSGIAVGGLSVGEEREDYERIASFSAKNLPADKPRYLMGVGSPRDILQAVSWGYDLFDCVLPTRMGRHGVAFGFDGYIHIRQDKWRLNTTPLVESCPCEVCRNYSKAFVRHLFTADEISAAILLTYHNLFFYFELMRKIRTAILEGNFASLAENLQEKLSRKL